MTETIAGISFTVSAASFFQVNSEMVAEIFTFLEPWLRGVSRIVDLYCGAGTFALFFATRGAQVVGIEENPHAVREARANAARNGVTARDVVHARPRRRRLAVASRAGGARRRRTPCSWTRRAKGATKRRSRRSSRGACAAHLVSVVQSRDAWRAISPSSCSAAIALRACSPSTCFRRPGTSRRSRCCTAPMSAPFDVTLREDVFTPASSDR